MSLMHNLLAGSLRVLGRDRDASEVEAAASAASEDRPQRRQVEEIPLAPPDVQPSPRMIFDTADHATAGAPGAHGSGGSGSGSGSGSESPNSAPEAGAGGGGSGAGAAAGGEHGGGHSGGRARGEQAPSEAPDKLAVQDAAHDGHQAAARPLADLAADPLAGLYSERLRERVEQEAFRSASSTAQDAEIARRASDLLPSELRSVLHHAEPRFDVSKDARSARIDALGGEIPRWAKGNPENDPSIIRLMDGSRAQSAPMAGHHQTSTEAHAAPSHRTSNQMANSPSAQPSNQASASPSRAAGRELER